MQLSPLTFTDLRNLIYERTGIFFPENKKYVLESRLQARLKERHCGSYEEYFQLLKYDAWRDQELNAVYNLVTTNETFFYRDLPQLQEFTNMIVPAVAKANASTSRIRVWSAACSSGDEPYTLAMMTLEHPALANWVIDILGSDISETALGAARTAIYGSYAVRNVPPIVMNKYFQREAGQYVLSDKVKQLVKFAHMNRAAPITRDGHRSGIYSGCGPNQGSIVDGAGSGPALDAGRAVGIALMVWIKRAAAQGGRNDRCAPACYRLEHAQRV